LFRPDRSLRSETLTTRPFGPGYHTRVLQPSVTARVRPQRNIMCSAFEGNTQAPRHSLRRVRRSAWARFAALENGRTFGHQWMEGVHACVERGKDAFHGVPDQIRKRPSYCGRAPNTGSVKPSPPSRVGARLSNMAKRSGTAWKPSLPGGHSGTTA
jgi:hypothetical protein